MILNNTSRKGPEVIYEVSLFGLDGGVDLENIMKNWTRR
jgi:hypothetical protein